MSPNNHNSQRQRRGLTLIEVAAVLVCLLIVVVIAYLFLGGTLTNEGVPASRLKVKAQLKQIHQSFVALSRELEGTLPRPGLLTRGSGDFNGTMPRVPDREVEDVTQNTTDNLYSILIMRVCVLPDTLIAPSERNPNVRVDRDYDFDVYDPLAGIYWDPAFKADLTRESNASFAHLVLGGERLQHWREHFATRNPVLSSRGPKDGVRDPASYTCDKESNWFGYVAFNDNSVTVVNDMTVDETTTTLQGKTIPDNIFSMESGPLGADIILSFTTALTEKTVELQHD